MTWACLSRRSPTRAAAWSSGPGTACKGWELLTDAVIRHIAQGTRPVVFMLWGSHAQSKRAFIPADRGHLVLTSNHPSPLSALRPPVPFIGNGHFGKARDFRAQHGY